EFRRVVFRSDLPQRQRPLPAEQQEHEHLVAGEREVERCEGAVHAGDEDLLRPHDRRDHRHARGGVAPAVRLPVPPGLLYRVQVERLCRWHRGGVPHPRWADPPPPPALRLPVPPGLLYRVQVERLGRCHRASVPTTGWSTSTPTAAVGMTGGRLSTATYLHPSPPPLPGDTWRRRRPCRLRPHPGSIPPTTPPLRPRSPAAASTTRCPGAGSASVPSRASPCAASPRWTSASWPTSWRPSSPSQPMARSDSCSSTRTTSTSGR